MIEVVASMSRGPVFLAGELLECLITFTNPMSHLSTSASRYLNATCFFRSYDQLICDPLWPSYPSDVVRNERYNRPIRLKMCFNIIYTSKI